MKEIGGVAMWRNRAVMMMKNVGLDDDRNDADKATGDDSDDDD